MRSVFKNVKRNDVIFLIVLSFVFFLLRLPSLFEPHWYGDEGIYQVIGDVLNRGSLLYRDIWDNKPPLLYLLYAIFNTDQFTLKLVSLAFGVFSIIIFFFLSKRLFPQYLLTSSIFTLLLGLPIIEGNIANAENFMMLPILAAAFLIFNFSQQSSTLSVIDNVKSQKSKVKSTMKNSKFINLQLIIAGLLLGIAFLFKVVAVFDFAALFLFLLFSNLESISKRHSGLSRISHRSEKQKGFWSRFAPQNDGKGVLKQVLKRKLFPFLFGFLIPIFVTVFYFWMQGAFTDFFKATFSSNFGYVAWQNKFIFPHALLVFKSALLIGAVVFIIRHRKVLSPNTIFILLWFLFSFYNVFFTQRPYTHYLLTLLPSAALLFGLIFSEKKYQRAMTIFFILAFVLVLKNFNFYRNTVAYYQNFVSFLIGGKSVVSYREFFDEKTPIDYEIANFIKSKIREKDSLFIWGDNAQVYKLVGATPPGKYIVSYHIMGNKDGVENTRYAIEKKKPRFIIIMPDQNPVPFQLVGYFERINIDKVTIYERFF